MWAGHVTIDMLSDDVLLCTFYFVQPDIASSRFLDLSWWQPVIHVCHRWRSVVFASPNFFRLRLVCDPWIPVGLTAIWPPIPIIVWNMRNVADRAMPEDYDLDAAIVHPDRVHEIHLRFASSQLQRLASAMQKQFPALIHLTLETFRDSPPALALPDGFLGGFAPRLQFLDLNRIPFPALPKLLLSATDLVHLSLWNIPHSGYISPDTIITSLAVLLNLESFIIEFDIISFPDRGRRHPPPPTRIVLPALTVFEFQGASIYLEDLLAQIDAPWLDCIRIAFVHQFVFDIPELAKFLRRTTRFSGQVLNEAHVDFDCCGVVVESLPPTRIIDKKFGLRILCQEFDWSDWDPSFVAQIFSSLFPSIYIVEHLYVRVGPEYLLWQDDFEDIDWLEIFRPFAAVKSLYLCEQIVEYIAPDLQDLRERAADVLPALKCIFLEELQPSESDPPQEAFGEYVAARQLLGHPVAVSRWVGEM